MIARVHGVEQDPMRNGVIRGAINWLLRTEEAPPCGFKLELLAVLDDGTRVSDGRFTRRSFTTVTAVPKDDVDTPAEPSRAQVERVALKMVADPPARRWSGLMRSLRDIGVDTSMNDLDALPIDVELDDRAQRLLARE